jgi:hypothetical protein
MTAETVLVGRRWRVVGGKRRRDCEGWEGKRCGNYRDREAVAQGRSWNFAQGAAAIHNCPHGTVGFNNIPGIVTLGCL